MKNLSLLSHSIVMAAAIAGASTITMMSSQAAINNNKITESVAAAQSKISLQQAITIGNKAVKGDVVSAEFDRNDYSRTAEYELAIIANNTEYEVKVDANTGKVLRSKQERLDADDKAEYNAMKRATVTLTQAMQTAAQHVKGKAIGVEFDMKKGQPVYKVEVAEGNQAHKVIIDSMTGKVISSRLDNDD